VPEASHPDGHPGSHRRPRHGSQLGHKSARSRCSSSPTQAVSGSNYATSPRPSGTTSTAKLTCWSADAADRLPQPRRGHTAPDGRPACSLTDLGRTAVELIRRAAGA
jgi:hypothetical protein